MKRAFHEGPSFGRVDTVMRCLIARNPTCQMIHCVDFLNDSLGR